MSVHLKHKFLNFVLERQLIPPDSRVLLAVSGGMDSMVLLYLMHAWQRRLACHLGVVHLHHGIRDVTADRDMKLVAETARHLGLPFFPLRADVPEVARRQNLSLEEAGHVLRQTLFEELAGRQNFSLIATGHHADDQAETVLHRLIQGTGLQGLAGIRLQRGRWIRPLLFARRSEIARYAREKEIPFRTDETNADLRFERNKIRHHLLPLLEEQYNPRVTVHLTALAETLSEWDRYLDEQLRQALQSRIIEEAENKIKLDISGYSGYFSWIKIRLLEYIFNQYFQRPQKVSTAVFRAFNRWLQTGRNGSEFEWKNGIRAVKQTGHAYFFRPDSPGEAVLKVQEGRLYHLPEAGIKIEISTVGRDAVVFSDRRDVEFLAGDRMRFPLTLRHWQKGDRFVPLGCDYEVRVSDYLTDKKILNPDRKGIRVLVNRDEIVAILGVQISDVYKVSENSRKILRLTVRNG